MNGSPSSVSPKRPPSFRKDHPQCDREENNAAGDADSLLLKTQQRQNAPPEKKRRAGRRKRSYLSDQTRRRRSGYTFLSTDRNGGMLPSGSITRNRVRMADRGFITVIARVH